MVGKNAGKDKRISEFLSEELKIVRRGIKKKVRGLREIIAERMPSGIPGLDKIMEGGFKKGSTNLIGGGAGSGKSILAMQFLVKGVDECGEPGIYISFEEDQKKVIAEFSGFGWQLDKKVKEGKLMILNYSPQQVERVVAYGGGTVRDAVESIKAKRLVIDSLTAFTLLHKGELKKRKAMLELFERLRSWGCTSLLTQEQEPASEEHLSSPLEFEVDSVVLLYYLKQGNKRNRFIEVFKMRGTEHSNMIFPMSITRKKGVVVKS